MKRSYLCIYEYESTVFGVDEIKSKDIQIFVKNNLKKCEYLFQRIANKSATSDMYSNYEKLGFINISAIKFKGRQRNNARIYCKDFIGESNKRYIILVEYLHSKKQTKLRDKEIALIKRIVNYEY